MQKPTNYDSENAVNIGDYETLEPGGYICRILKAQITKSSGGKDMLVIGFDIAEGEKKDYYARKFNTDTRADKKWPGRYFQVTEGESMKFFKGMIKSIEESNPGFVFDFDENKLTGKFFGGVFGREEWFNISSGAYQFITKLLWIRNTETIRGGNFKVPKDKLANRNGMGTAPPAIPGAPPGFFGEILPNDEDLPF